MILKIPICWYLYTEVDIPSWNIVNRNWKLKWVDGLEGGFSELGSLFEKWPCSRVAYWAVEGMTNSVIYFVFSLQRTLLRWIVLTVLSYHYIDIEWLKLLIILDITYSTNNHCFTTVNIVNQAWFTTLRSPLKYIRGRVQSSHCQ